MGSFFTNYQVFTGNTNVEINRESIINSLHRLILNNDYVEAPDSADVDRTIAIGPNSEKPWISIYDEDAECQDMKAFDKLASELSNDLKCWIVGIMVHDSDRICVRLFFEGKLVEFLKNNNGRFAKSSKKKSVKTSQINWNDILHDGTTFEDLERMCKKNVVFVEEILDEIATLLDFDIDLCSTGYNNKKVIGINDCTLLRFNSPQKTKCFSLGTGATKFEFRSWLSKYQNFRGKEGVIETCLSNTGKESTGFKVAIWGSAIEENLIEINNIEVVQNGVSTFQVPYKCKNEANETLLTSNFKKIEIVQGIVVDYERYNMKLMKKIIEKQYESAFIVIVHIKGLRRCISEISITFSPDINSVNGQIGYKIPIYIDDSSVE